MPNVELLLFKEMLTDDYRKVRNASNLAETGGGARDFRYPRRFLPTLEAMFPTVAQIRGKECRIADLHYVRDGSARVSANVEFHPAPTPSRAANVWIGRVSAYDALANPPANNDERVFFALRLDSAGVLHSRYMRESEIRSEGPLSVVMALEAAEARTARRSAIVFEVSLPVVDVGRLMPKAALSDDESVDNAIKRRIRRGRDIRGVEEEPLERETAETERQFVQATYNYELHEFASRSHATTLKALARYLRDLGFSPAESNIDAYVVESSDVVLFEVKSIREENERAQTRKAVGQLLDYAFFELPEEVAEDADVTYAIVYSEKPSDRTQSFLESIDMLVFWLGDGLGLIEGTVVSAQEINELAAKYHPRAGTAGAI